MQARMGSTQVSAGLGMVAAAAVVWCLAAGSALAATPVIDAPHTIKTAFGWMAQYRQMLDQYRRQGEQLQTLTRQYEQMRVGGDVFRGSPGHRERFESRDPDAGISERCGPAPAKNPVGAQQYGYCSAIVRMENRRFNAMVEMLGDVEGRDAELRDAYAERAGIGPDEQGRLESNTNRILSIQSQLQNDVQNAGTLMDAYDAALRGLREDQIRAANLALKRDEPGDGLVQGAALRLALQAARARER